MSIKKNNSNNKHNHEQKANDESPLALPTKPYWPQIRSFLRRFPTELQEHILSHALTASSPIPTDTVFTPQGFDKPDSELTCSRHFCFDPEASRQELAAAFFCLLRQNSFVCKSKHQLRSLASRIACFSAQEAPPASPTDPIVLPSPTPPVVSIYQPTVNIGRDGDSNDDLLKYDNKHQLGLRAFRVLTALLKFPSSVRFERLNLFIRQRGSFWNTLFTVAGDTNQELQFVGIVIGKLKNRMDRSGTSKALRVSTGPVRRSCDPSSAQEEMNITWLWNGITTEEAAELKAWAATNDILEEAKRTENYRNAILQLNHALGLPVLYLPHRSRRTPIPSVEEAPEKAEEYRTRLNRLEEKRAQLNWMLTMYERSRVAEFVADPKWEEKLDALAKVEPRHLKEYRELLEDLEYDNEN